MAINFKSKKTWIIIAAAVIVIVAVILIIRRNRKEKKSETETGTAVTGTDAGSVNTTEAKYPLRPRMAGYSAENGSYGWQIKVLQKALNDINGSGLTLDGKFGPKTLDAVKAAFPSQIGDDSITKEEFNSMCDVIREGYAAIGLTLASNDELKLTIKG